MAKASIIPVSAVFLRVQSSCLPALTAKPMQDYSTFPQKTVLMPPDFQGELNILSPELPELPPELPPGLLGILHAFVLQIIFFDIKISFIFQFSR